MLERMTIEQFDERFAANQLDPLDSSWHQTGTIASTIHNELRQALYNMSGKDLPDKEINAPSDYYPPMVAGDDEEEKQAEQKKADAESWKLLEAKARAITGI